MEVLWPALAITVIVIFVFYVLAQHWQRVLRQQSWTILRLFERVQNLEEMNDPEFRRRLTEAAPPPLEQVFTLSFSFDDRFWCDSLRTTDAEQKFIREYGSFVGSVKIERWRSHTVATITEVLPDHKISGWSARSIDVYSDPRQSSESVTLWELALSRPVLSAERPPSLELILRGNGVELCGHLVPCGASAHGNGKRMLPAFEDISFFRVPLDSAQLVPFRSRDLARDGGDGNQTVSAQDSSARANSWQALYSDRNEELGIEWTLRVRDLTKKSEWERWKILDSGAVPFATEKK